MNKKLWLGILVMLLVFGMMVIGCEAEKEVPPYPQKIDVTVQQASWDSTEPRTTGSVEIRFNPPLLGSDDYTGTPAKVGVDDLQWLEASGITLTQSGGNGRTVSITSIEKTQGGNRASAKVFLTRSAPPATPPGTFGKAVVSISFPNEFTAKYPDGVSWYGDRTFDF